MSELFGRTELLFGKEAMDKLKGSRVAVFGIGGVGGYTVEALARSGVGTLDIFDDDTICVSNINRQIIATTRTIGRNKVDVMKERVLDINPEAIVNAYQCFYGPDQADQYDFTVYDYIVDAIDTVTAKLELVVRAQAAGTPIISCMGAGNKLDSTALEVTDIYKTSVCPLAKVMRKELKARRIRKLKVVYSKELPRKPLAAENGSSGEELPSQPLRAGKPKRQTPGSTAFVPSVAGLIIAGEVVKDITGIR